MCARQKQFKLHAVTWGNLLHVRGSGFDYILHISYGRIIVADEDTLNAMDTVVPAKTIFRSLLQTRVNDLTAPTEFKFLTSGLKPKTFIHLPFLLFCLYYHSRSALDGGKTGGQAL
eukprot:1478410-Amphidinium_carterae.1